MNYTVITKVADPTTGGNLAMALPLDLYRQVEEGNAENGWIGRFEPLDLGPAAIFTLRAPVFRVGEVLALDENDRDQWTRKPDKWDIETETFDTAEAAFARAFEVCTAESERRLAALNG